ncbi:MAG: hypothetical protein LC808_00260 [Actinobacteria bacterium]|nr:hypothetical protein [Actinomycetota bacterium]
MNPDGSAIVNLTNSHESGEWWPDWSPDGTHIAFYREAGTNDEIFVMNADGTGQLNVTNHPSDDGDPSWAPATAVERPPCTIWGTSGGDVLMGTASRDVVCAGGGNDLIRSLRGNDVVYAGQASTRYTRDSVPTRSTVERGNDRIRGGPGYDYISGQLGKVRFSEVGVGMTFAAASGTIICGRSTDSWGTTHFWAAQLWTPAGQIVGTRGASVP